MKTLFILILTCIISWFSTAPLTLVEATKYDYAGGRRESGRGTMYNFTFEVNSPANSIEVAQLFIEDRVFVFEKNDPRLVFEEKEGKNYLKIQIQRHWQPNENQVLTENNEPAIATKRPIDYDGNALLEFRKKGKTMYLKIDKITSLARQQYQ